MKNADHKYLTLVKPFVEIIKQNSVMLFVLVLTPDQV